MSGPGDTERSITVRYVWADIITDLDSEYAAYAYVSSVSIGS